MSEYIMSTEMRTKLNRKLEIKKEMDRLKFEDEQIEIEINKEFYIEVSPQLVECIERVLLQKAHPHHKEQVKNIMSNYNSGKIEAMDIELLDNIIDCNEDLINQEIKKEVN